MVVPPEPGTATSVTPGTVVAGLPLLRRIVLAGSRAGSRVCWCRASRRRRAAARRHDGAPAERRAAARLAPPDRHPPGQRRAPGQMAPGAPRGRGRVRARLYRRTARRGHRHRRPGVRARGRDAMPRRRRADGDVARPVRRVQARGRRGRALPALRSGRHPAGRDVAPAKPDQATRGLHVAALRAEDLAGDHASARVHSRHARHDDRRERGDRAARRAVLLSGLPSTSSSGRSCS